MISRGAVAPVSARLISFALSVRSLASITETTFKVRALLLGERIDLRAWSAADALSTNPLTVRVPAGGVAEIADKPEILWENPLLEALFVKVEDELEISARHAALERKLNLIAKTAQTVVPLVSNKHSLRVEWYIVILIMIMIMIMIAIMLMLYDLFLSTG